MTQPWPVTFPTKFKDEYELALRKLVKRKAAGKTIEAPEEKDDRSNVIDLMEALRRSVKGKEKRATRRNSSVKGKTIKPDYEHHQTLGSLSLTSRP